MLAYVEPMLDNGALLLQLLVGGVFLLAAAAKLLHLSEFRAAARGFGFVRYVSSNRQALRSLC